MELRICKDSEEMVHLTSSWLIEKVKSSKVQSAYLPAGSTPIPLYKFWHTSPPSYLEKLQLIQIDDVLTGPKAGLFRNFFQQHLPHLQTQFSWINTEFQQADLAILGLGLNGHIAFHEPGLPLDFSQGCVLLSESTRQSLGLPEQTWGITYGALAFLNTKSILMMVSGAAKKEALQRLLKGDLSLPASFLLQHPDFTVLADSAAHG